ncbi:protein of unknown function [Nitrospira defluvii]|uniref:Uncharacterized protein n=1 Tax=Nitrospira defluvii TaxID=330214 RepID=D8PBS4_9BACT|nr:protein of unknown function [Nitrospira defluvii]
MHRALDVRLTATTVECFHKGQRVASHLRSGHLYKNGWICLSKRLIPPEGKSNLRASRCMHCWLLWDWTPGGNG